MSRPLPHNVDLEAAVLGSVMLRNEALGDIGGILGADDFWHRGHRAVYLAMQYMFDREQPIDPLTLEHRLRATDELGLAGGADGLMRLMARSPSSYHVEKHAADVAMIARRRRLVEKAREIAERGCESVEDEAEFLSTAEREILAAAERRGGSNGKPTSELVAPWFQSMCDQAKLKNPVIGIPTNLHLLDTMIGGLQGGKQIVIAGRPGHGKTALACGMVAAASVVMEPRDEPREVFPSLFFSLEMGERELTGRIVTGLARVDSKRIKAGALTQDEFERIQRAAAAVHEAPIIIDDNESNTIEEIRATSRRWRRSKAFACSRKSQKDPTLGLIVIDYGQLVETATKHDSREQAVSYISRQSKKMSKELKCPVLFLSQLNRGVDNRADHRPGKSDLRESGSIEQDADIILFTYREAEYMDKGSAEYRNAERFAEAIVDKQRDGPTGTVHLDWTGAYTRFDNPAEHR